MGQSTDAILYYGFDLGEDEGELPDDPLFDAFREDGTDDEDCAPDFEDLYRQKKGLVKPTGKAYDSPEWSAYFAQRRALLGAEPCEMDQHCSCDYPIYFVCLKASKLVAMRGRAQDVPAPLESKPEWEAQLRAYCDVMGVTWRQPTWRLASYWDW